MKIGMRELLFLAMLLAMPFAAWWFVFRPGNQQIAQARVEIDAKRQKLDQLAAMTKDVQDMGPQLNRLTEKLALFEAKIPAEKDVDVILKQVTQLTAKHELKSLSTRADKIVKTGKYWELPFKMKIQGDFEGFYAFLQDVERLSRITKIGHMKLAKLKDSDGLMEADFTLSVYFEPQDAANKPAKVALGR